MKRVLKQSKGFICGVLVTVMILSGITAIANPISRQITVLTGHINIVLDEQPLIPRDVHGNEVQPFVFEGTTYLPIRAVASAVGLDVDWDGETSTVILTTIAEETPEPPTEPPTQPPTEPPVEPPVQPPGTQSALVGTWNYMGEPFYIFETDGRGIMTPLFLEIHLRWSTRNGILEICTTPSSCGNNCTAPSEWYYEIDGNRLILTSTLAPEIVNIYTRG